MIRRWLPAPEFGSAVRVPKPNVRGRDCCRKRVQSVIPVHVSDERRRKTASRVGDAWIGDERAGRLASLERQVQELDDVTSDAFAVEVVPITMKGEAIDRWQRLVEAGDDAWAYVISDRDGVLAVDQVTELGFDSPASAVINSTTHMRLVAWWLFHAWRISDLLHDSVTNVRDWRLLSGAVTTRALLEEVACLTYEAARLGDAWSEAKAATGTEVERANVVQHQFAPLLVNAAFGTRVSAAAGAAPTATNVLTYVKHLSKSVGRPEVTDHYDWLSDAAHPAFGARIATASDGMLHESKAVYIRYHDRRPMALVGQDSTRRFSYPIAGHILDTLDFCGEVVGPILEQSLEVIDDFCLTTGAALYSTRDYWRKLTPTRGSRKCECGRGKWSACGHWWGGDPPIVELPRRDPNLS